MGQTVLDDKDSHQAVAQAGKTIEQLDDLGISCQGLEGNSPARTVLASDLVLADDSRVRPEDRLAVTDREVFNLAEPDPLHLLDKSSGNRGNCRPFVIGSGHIGGFLLRNRPLW